MSLDYIAKHEATSFLKFKLTMWAKKRHGSVGFKGERVFLVLLKVKSAQLHQREPHQYGGQIHGQGKPLEVIPFHMMVSCLHTLTQDPHSCT